jgi:polyhydroxybutyrate depolymerase
LVLLAGVLAGVPAVASQGAADDPVGAAVPVPAPNGAAGTDEYVKIVVNGLPRTYRLFIPTELPDTPVPLVVVLHPFNGTSTGYESNSNFDLGAGKTATLVAYPQGFENSWNAGTCCGTARDLKIDDVAFIDTVINDIETRYSVDETRLAIGGFSNGAMMSYRYVCERSDRIHVMFSGSGAYMAPSCDFSRPVDVLHMHGMKDGLVPWGGTASSPYPSDGVMPSVLATGSVMASRDGCSTRWVGSVVNSLVNKYVPATCPDGAAIAIFQSKTLMHGWVTGSSAVGTYGINETNLAWTWLYSSWKSA